jgi:fatty-acyl-CoA synthase
MPALTSAPELLRPATSDPAEIERVPLDARGLPASTYHPLARAANLWPQRPAILCRPDSERWQQPSSRTFAEAATDVHRAASVYAGFGVGREDAVAIVSVTRR